MDKNIKAMQPSIAGQSQATEVRAVPSKFVLGFWIEDGRIEFSEGDFSTLKDGTYHVVTAPVLAAPTAQEVTQQAAKAETAEQDGLLGEILALAEQGMCHGLLADDYCSQIVAKIKNLAPTTSTVSAPDEIRNAALEEAALAAEKVRDDYSEKQGGKWPELRDDAATGAGDCVAAIRALRTTSTDTGSAA